VSGVCVFHDVFQLFFRHQQVEVGLWTANGGRVGVSRWPVRSSGTLSAEYFCKYTTYPYLSPVPCNGTTEYLYLSLTYLGT
jgi:hypothetical protein